MKKKILITGSSGFVGSNTIFILPNYLEKKYNFILTDIVKPKFSYKNYQFMKADISKMNSIKKVFRKYNPDIVVHLAANQSKKTSFEKLLPNNIIGTYNIFELSHKFNCERVVFSSSLNAVNNYPEGIIIKDDFLPNPKSLYGATKIWGEALARLYSVEKNISSICIRFGKVVDKNVGRINTKQKEEEIFNPINRLITFEDSAQLIAKSIEAPRFLKFFIAHGISDNKKKRLSLKKTKKILNYKPIHDCFELVVKNKIKRL
jgi:UDP-glucose 4-epimerase